MSRLALYLLGAPHAECDGAPLITDTRKAIALLAYLAMTGQAHTRDALATLLWPELDQTRARAALRRTLSSINGACDATWLLADRETVDLERTDSVWCDATAFSAALAECRRHGHASNRACARCLEPLERAAALYRDDFMAGFSLRDSVNFDDWQFFQAEGLRREAAEVLEQLVILQGKRHAWQPAIVHARRRLALDALHEPAHRQLMLLYAWSGERGAALRQYQVCSDVLARELDVPPLPETTALFQAIKEQREPPPPARAEMAASGARGTDNEAAPTAPATPIPPQPPTPGGAEPAPRYPLVGRAHELARLQELYTAQGGQQGTGRLVLLEGEAGIGKTRLAEAFMAAAQQQGARTVTARCYEGEQELAYAPILQALRSALALPGAAWLRAALEPHERAALHRLLPELEGSVAGMAGAPVSPATPAPAPAPFPPEGALEDDGAARVRLFEAVARLLSALLAGPQPGVLLVDDIQWADSASLDLLAWLVHRPAAYPLLLLATLRVHESAQEARVRALFADAQRRYGAALITLTRLGAADVRALAAAAHAAPALIDPLLREAEGLPFFVVAYLDALAANGAAGAADAGDAPGTDLPQPESIRALLRARLARVEETERQLLTTAAVIGRAFAFDTLRAASGRGEEETLVAIEGLLARGLVRELDDGAYDFSHEQLRAVVYADTTQVRRRLLHRRVAEALQAQARLAGQDVSSVAATLAHHAEQAGQRAEAARWCFIAGAHAADLYANLEAVGHLRRAAALGYADDATLHLRLGDVLTLQGAYDEATAEYATAARSAPDALRPALDARLGRVWMRLGDYARAADCFDRARTTLPATAHAARAQLLADAALAAYRQGNPAQAGDYVNQALGAAQAAGDQPALTRAHTMCSHLLRTANPAAALDHAQQAVALAAALAAQPEAAQQQPALLTAALNALGLAHAAGGDPAQAVPPLSRALALCATQGDRHREAALHNNLADVLHLCGDAEQAMAHLKQAVAIFAAIGGGGDNPEIWKLTEW